MSEDEIQAGRHEMLGGRLGDLVNLGFPSEVLVAIIQRYTAPDAHRVLNGILKTYHRAPRR